MPPLTRGNPVVGNCRMLGGVDVKRDLELKFFKLVWLRSLCLLNVYLVQSTA